MSCRYAFNTDGFTASTRFAKLLATGQVRVERLEKELRGLTGM